jgi:L-iditol 2-dehydrogenase
MKIVAVTGEQKCELQEQPDPKITENFVKVKIHTAPMCTEFKGFKSGEKNACLGHEAAGEVVEIAQPGRVKVGDRVVVMPQYACGRCSLCRDGDYIYCENNIDALKHCKSASGTATYAQYCIKQDWLLLPIPAGMSYDHAAMACCGLGPTFGAMQTMNVSKDDVVLILGLGAVGLGGVVNAVYRGATVIALEGNPYRAKLARDLCANEVIDPADPEAVKKIRRASHGGANKIVDCVGVPAAQKLAIEASRKRAQMAVVGWGGNVDTNSILRQGMTLMGNWHWNLNDAARLMGMIAEIPAVLDQLITHRFPMSSVEEAFKLQMQGQCGKVLLHPWE